MITKYQLFEKLNGRGSKSLTEEEFNQILKKNCKNWTKAKTPLYRGQKDLGPYVYTDPSGTYRKSIDDVNTHIELMSNLPCWKDYPKYSSSVIGISGMDSSYTEAEGYGKVYEIIPFDNVEIAVCPQPTIWESFGGFGDDDGIYLVYNFLEGIGINADIWVSPEGKTIEEELKSIDYINPHPDNEFLKQASEYLKKGPDEITGKDCYDFINNYLFNPVVREFTMVKYVAGFEIPKAKQIWTEGPVLLIYRELS